MKCPKVPSPVEPTRDPEDFEFPESLTKTPPPLSALPSDEELFLPDEQEQEKTASSRDDVSLHEKNEKKIKEQEYPRIWSAAHSEPIPAFSSREKGGFWIRSIAYLIDKTLLSMIGLLFFLAFHIAQGSGLTPWQNFFTTLILMYCTGLIIEAAYFIYFYGYTGQTIGKMICGLKVVSVEGELIGYRRAFLRWIGYARR